MRSSASAISLSRAVWFETHRRSPVLVWLGLGHLLLIPLELAFMLSDSRTLGGESVWIKPLRFDASIAIFALTMAWVLGALRQALRDRYAIRIAVAMCIETTCIALQAGRGVASHFNKTTPLNDFIFTLMGLAIVYNTYVVVRVLIHFVREREVVATALMRNAIVLGLTATLVGSVIGGLMAQRLTHAGWHGGDLRIAHFVALHGLQLMLGAGLVLSRTAWSDAARQRVLVGLFFAHFALVSVALLGA